MDGTFLGFLCVCMESLHIIDQEMREFPVLSQSGMLSCHSSPPLPAPVWLWVINTTQAPGAGETRMGVQSHLQMVTVTSGALPTYIQK